MGTNQHSGQTWDDARKSALVAQIVSGKLSVKDACERHQLSAETIQDWVRVFRRTTLQALDDHLRQTFLIQGADAASLGSAEYTGTLADIPLADLLQTFQMGAKDGVITVTCDGRRSRIWCQRGEVIDAESGRLRGEAAAYRILGLERGQVFADFRGEPRERSVSVPVNLLLLEAARRKDESVRVLQQLDGLRSVYAQARQASDDTSAAERELLAQCDGTRDVGALLEQSALGDLETLTAISSLLQHGELIRTQRGSALVVSKETPNAIVSADILNSMASLPPLGGSQLPQRRARRGGPLFAVGTALALGAVLWSLSRSRSAPYSTQPTAPAARAPSARTLPSVMPATPESYEIDTLAEPGHAQLWLDGVNTGVGHLRRELVRDGQTHSLRVVAEGYVPATVLFADAPPPGRIALEKLTAAVPRPAVAQPTPAAHVAPSPSVVPEPTANSQPDAVPAAPPAPRVKRVGGTSPRATERPRSAERAAAAPDATVSGAPRVQIIESNTPVVRIIE